MRQIRMLMMLAGLVLFSNCSSNDPDPAKERRFYASIPVDGLERSYLVNLPPEIPGDTTRLPLVVGIHGTGGSATQFETHYRFSSLADKERFIAIYPEGIRGNGVLGIRSWNAGTCCHTALDNNVDDVKFIRLLVEKIMSDYPVDPSRVYVVGMSNGGMLAYRLACELPETFAAVAVVSGTMVAQTCHPSRPLPIVHIHDVNDTTVPYYGGTGLGGYTFPSVDSVLDVWSALDNCREMHVTDHTTFQHTVWSGCDDNTILERYLTYDGGHAWPGGMKARRGADEPSKAIDANDIIWAFFQRYHLRE